MVILTNKKVLIDNLVKKVKIEIIALLQWESILLFQKIRKKISVKSSVTIVIIKTIILIFA